MIIVGIDPGINGAIAVLDDGALVALHDMPKMQAKSGKNIVNAPELHKLLVASCADKIILEQVGGRPGESAPWAFNFGRSFGMIEGVAFTLGLPVHYVSPVKWKRSAGVPAGKENKDSARGIAQQLYPEASLGRKKDIDRAEAILIAKYGEDTL